MSNPDILNELNSIEASASLVVERCQKLRQKLGPVSTGAKQKKGISEADKARIRERKTVNRKRRMRKS